MGRSSKLMGYQEVAAIGISGKTSWLGLGAASQRLRTGKSNENTLGPSEDTPGGILL